MKRRLRRQLAGRDRPGGGVLTHLHIVKASFLRRSYYRFELLFDAIKAVVAVLVLVAIWREIYADRTDVGGYSMEQIVLYTCTASALALLFNVDLARYMADKIRTGAVALDFIKPINIGLYHLSDTLGGVLYSAVFAAVPTYAALTILFGVADVFNAMWLAALPLAVLGFLLHYVFCHVLALTTFFTVEAWGIEFFRINIVRFFAGGFLPITLFPEPLRAVSDVLPFQYMIFPAASAVAGRFALETLSVTLAAQVAWLAILLVADQAFWRLAVRQVTVHGG